MLINLATDVLIAETKRNDFLYRQTPTSADTTYGYELFRRAIMSNCQICWSAIYDIYVPQISVWVIDAIGLYCELEDVVSKVLVRFWRKVDAAFFTNQLNNLNAILKYLKRIARSTAIDAFRFEKRHYEKRAEIDNLHTYHINDDFSSWLVCDYFRKQLKTQQEIVVFDLMLCGYLQSADVYALYPSLFTDIRQVYRRRDSVLKKLRRLVRRNANVNS